MSSVELGALSAMSYCWHKHEDSFFLVRAAKAIAGAVKATFGKFTVELLQEAKPLMLCHPDAWFAAPVKRALDDYDVSVAQDTARQPATAGSPPPSATAGSPSSSATAGSSPPLPQPQQVRGNSPLSFSLNETDTTRVKFVSGRPEKLKFVSDAYREMRAAAGDSWVANAGVICEEIMTYDVDHIAFMNKNHEVISKYLVTVAQEIPTGKGKVKEAFSMEEVLLVRDSQTGQNKLVRIGSFSESQNGSTAGGAGFPGYSQASSTKAGCYLRNLKCENKKGEVYEPYAKTKFGIGRRDNNNIGDLWSCGFDALRMQLYQATGYKFSFQVLVAFVEEMLSDRDDAQQLREMFSRDKYPLSRDVMKIILSDATAAPDYPDLLVEKGTEHDNGFFFPDEKLGIDEVGGRVRICERSDILRTTDWDRSSTVMLGTPLHAYSVYRNKKTDGTFEYVVYDPHNFSKSPDFFTSANGPGRQSFATAKAAINHVSTNGGAANGKLYAFYRVPDAAMCLLRDKMMQTKNRLEENGDGF